MQEVNMEALDNLLGNAKAIERFNKWQLLKLELRAIEFWDAHYYANDPNRDDYEISAFKARQARRKEILNQLAK